MSTYWELGPVLGTGATTVEKVMFRQSSEGNLRLKTPGGQFVGDIIRENHLLSKGRVKTLPTFKIL